MAKLGSFGTLAFSVSDRTVRTFDGMTWNSSAKYATHDRHIKEDLLEFLGPELGEISFTMLFSVFIGTDPFREIEKLQHMVNTGETGRLILGGEVYGAYKWVATKAAAKLKKFDKKGNLLAAEVSVTLKEYPKR